MLATNNYRFGDLRPGQSNREDVFMALTGQRDAGLRHSIKARYLTLCVALVHCIHRSNMEHSQARFVAGKSFSQHRSEASILTVILIAGIGSIGQKLFAGHEHFSNGKLQINLLLSDNE